MLLLFMAILAFDLIMMAWAVIAPTLDYLILAVWRPKSVIPRIQALWGNWSGGDPGDYLIGALLAPVWLPCIWILGTLGAE